MSQLTKKLWNKLTPDSRSAIMITLGRSVNTFGNHWLIYNDYNHDFNYDSYGKSLKEILSHCRVQEDGTIDIVMTIRPTYRSSNAPLTQKPKQTQTAPEQSVWYVDYDYPVEGSDDRDLNHFWCYARSQSEALSLFRAEHYSPNIRVIQCYSK